MKRDGAGRGNWGTATDEGFPQLRLIQLVSVSWHDADSFCCCHVWSLMLFIMWVVVIRENVEAVNTEETPAVTEDEKKPEDAPQPEAEKVKEGAENEEDQKEAEEDKVYRYKLEWVASGMLELFLMFVLSDVCLIRGFTAKKLLTCHVTTVVQEMTLEEYEKVLEEKRKAILALKAEERKVEVDKELQSMQQLSVKKDAEEVFIKLGSDKEKKKENTEREERAKKSLSINEFLKPAEGERYSGGRGRGRGFRGRGEARGGYNGGGGGGRRPAAAPAIEDQSQFPTLGGK
uniref:Hyaluronan/mRNA-binding protein domain-containing protein n=1 Tax=Aegilops tauschii TaxID=37682 RepID=N1QUP2_AEGTA